MTLEQRSMLKNVGYFWPAYNLCAKTGKNYLFLKLLYYIKFVDKNKIS